jgi:hypothetical protein
MKKLLILIFIITISIGNVFSQNLTPPSSVIVSSQADFSGSIQVDPLSMDSTTLANLPHFLKLTITVEDIQSVVTVHIRVKKNNSTLFEEGVSFALADVQTNTYTYHRENNIVYSVTVPAK